MLCDMYDTNSIWDDTRFVLLFSVFPRFRHFNQNTGLGIAAWGAGSHNQYCFEYVTENDVCVALQI